MAGHIPPLTNYAFFPTTVRKKILAIQNQVQSELVLNQPCIVLVWNQFQLYLIPVQYTCHGTINSLYSAYASCYIHDSLHELEFTTSLIFYIFCIYLIMYLLAVKK